MKTIEYRVRPVTRYVVTRYTDDPLCRAGSVETLGEFDNERQAHAVVAAFQGKGTAEAPPNEYVIVQCTFGEKNPIVHYAYSEAEALERQASMQAEHDTTFRVFGRRRDDLQPA